jgi:ankyrin repeat protein
MGQQTFSFTLLICLCFLSGCQQASQRELERADPVVVVVTEEPELSETGLPISSVYAGALEGLELGGTYEEFRDKLMGCEGKRLDEYIWQSKDDDETLTITFSENRVYDWSGTRTWSTLKLSKGLSHDEVAKILGKPGQKTGTQIYLWVTESNSLIRCEVDDDRLTSLAIGGSPNQASPQPSIEVVDRTQEFFLALDSGDVAKIESLLKEDPNLAESVNPDGETPLIRAINVGKFDSVKALASQGFDLNAAGKWGRKPLLVACERGDLKMVKLLLSEGAKLHLDGSYERTELHVAAENGDIELAKFLLENGFTVDAVVAASKDGETPLISAVTAQQLEMVKFLVSRGANVNQKCGHYIKSQLDMTPLSIAQFGGSASENKEIAEYLTKHGAKLSHHKKK